MFDLPEYPDHYSRQVEWLDPTPVHWQRQRFRTLLHEYNAPSTVGDEQLLRVSQYSGVTERKTTTSEGIDNRSASLIGYKRVETDDLVVNIMLAWNGSLGVSKFEGVVSPAYCVYRFEANQDPWYYHYLLRTPQYRARIKAMSRGIVDSRLRLYSDDLYRLEAMVPPLDEQRAIVKYLGHAHARINAAITQKRKLIALLEEERQAIINQAVTRGLNPDAGLKDSGIPWLGDVPSRWEICALDRYWRVTDCKHMTVPFTDEGVPLASVRQAQRFELSFNDARRTSNEWAEELRSDGREPARGDIIYCRNVGVGAAAIVNTDEYFAMGQDVCLLRSKAQDPWFFNHYLHSAVMAAQMEQVLLGATFRRINVAAVKRLQIVVPPLPEQQAIVAYIDGKTASIDKAVAHMRREIELLTEFKTRLTSDVVTGQVDVRAVAATLPDLTDEETSVPDGTIDDEADLSEDDSADADEG